jgi:hypothetical protein
MKNYLRFAGLWIAVTAIVLLMTVLPFFRVVSLLPCMYADNSQLTRDENKKIKELVLDAIKDRCSALYTIDKSRIYDDSSRELIIQYDESASTDKNLICLIGGSFMNSVRKVSDWEYEVTVKVYYPENYYYCFTIMVEASGNYVIESFGIDI